MQKELTIRQLEIIKIIGKLLTTNGIKGLTIKNIATEMGFGESAIYRHFKSKEEIIITLLDYLFINIEERLSKIMHTKIDTEKKFINLFSSQFEFFQENPYFVIVVFSNLLEENELINSKLNKIIVTKTKYINQLIEEGKNNNIFTSKVSVQDMVHITLGTFRLLMFKWKKSNFQFDLVINGNSTIKSLLILLK